MELKLLSLTFLYKVSDFISFTEKVPLSVIHEGGWLPRYCHGFFLRSSTFQTHFVQLIKPSQVFVRPAGIQTLPSPVNSIIIIS